MAIQGLSQTRLIRKRLQHRDIIVGLNFEMDLIVLCLTQITHWTFFERKLGKIVVKYGNFHPQMQP
jgi:hypothetical protein